MPEKKRINCVKCRHFVVTWNSDFPNACKLFRFKSKKPPCFTVFEATGSQCEHFEEKKVKS